MQITIDLDDLELGEVEFVEEISGLTLQEMSGGKLTAKAVSALITVQKRRDNPAFTLDDARKIKVRDFDVAPNPTTAEADVT